MSPDSRSLRGVPIVGVLFLLLGASITAPADPAPCIGGMADGTYPCDGIDLQAFVGLNELRPGATAGSALWGFKDLNDGREYAFVGLSNGTSVVDVTRPDRPRVVGSVAASNSIWREIKVYQVFDKAAGRWKAYAYVTTEANVGLQIIDLTLLPEQVSLLGTYQGFQTAHTLFMANVDYSTGVANVPGVHPYLYVEGSNVCGLLVLSVDDPRSPEIIGCYDATYAHDVYTTVFSGARAVEQCAPGHDPCEVVFNFAGRLDGDDLRIIDYTDKSNPVLVGSVSYAKQGYTHSGWGSTDDNFLFLQDELDEEIFGLKTTLRTFDVHDVRNPVFVGGWRGPTGATDHNGHTLGNRYYMSNYTRGLTVLDVSEPEAPVQTGFFDTYPANDNTPETGAWATYPYLPSGNILVSNIEGPGGLFVLKEQTTNPDLVFVLRSRHLAPGKRLGVGASSSRAPECSLLAVGLGELSYDATRNIYRGAFLVDNPPDTVTVESSCGGNDTQGVPYP